MIDWHLVLLDRFACTDEEVLLERLARHAALGGPEHTYFRGPVGPRPHATCRRLAS